MMKANKWTIEITRADNGYLMSCKVPADCPVGDFFYVYEGEHELDRAGALTCVVEDIYNMVSGLEFGNTRGVVTVEEKRLDEIHGGDGDE